MDGPRPVLLLRSLRLQNALHASVPTRRAVMMGVMAMLRETVAHGRTLTGGTDPVKGGRPDTDRPRAAAGWRICLWSLHLSAMPIRSADRSVRLRIRPAAPGDADAMWAILQSVLATRDTLPFGDSLDYDTFLAHWFGGHAAHVATEDDRVVGLYKVGANYPDLGAHVASATYVVDPAAQGRGVGRALVEHSIEQARGNGFLAMQFNYVVSTNEPAVALYRKLGFEIVGTLPGAFRHGRLGLVDVHVMHRFL